MKGTGSSQRITTDSERSIVHENVEPGVSLDPRDVPVWAFFGERQSYSCSSGTGPAGAHRLRAMEITREVSVKAQGAELCSGGIR